MGSSGGGSPKVSSQERELFEEQGEIAIQQRKLLEQQSNTQGLLSPILFREIGLDPVLKDPNDPDVISKREEISELERLLSLPGREGVKPGAPRRRMEEALETLNNELFVLETGPQGFERTGQSRAKLRENLEGEFLQQILSGLSDGEPRNPGLIRDLNKRQIEEEDRLRKRFGDRFRETTVGQQSLDLLDESKGLLFDASREQDIAQGFGLFNQSRNAAQAQSDAFINNAISIAQGQLPIAQGFGQAASASAAGLSQLGAIRNAGVQSAPQASPFSGALGSLAGQGLGAIDFSDLFADSIAQTPTVLVT